MGLLGIDSTSYLTEKIFEIIDEDNDSKVLYILNRYLLVILLNILTKCLMEIN